MDKKINYNDVPKNYLFCNHHKCPRGNKCLRYQATLSIPQSVTTYTAVNPSHIIGNENNCTFFSLFQAVCFASGISHLLDNVPHATAISIHQEIYSLLGRSMYYRIRTKKRLLHPKEQKQIAAIFLKYKIDTPPVFETYIEKYDW